jgi:hypothetical protein
MPDVPTRKLAGWEADQVKNLIGISSILNLDSAEEHQQKFVVGRLSR